MADVPPRARQGNEEVDNNALVSSDIESESSIPEWGEEGDKLCTRIPLPENIAAYIEKRELIRDTNNVRFDDGSVEQVMTDYVVAKTILSNLNWRDKMLCKLVCSTWRSAVNTLRREQMSAVDFTMDVRRCSSDTRLYTSAHFNNEPLAVLSFANLRGFNMSCACKFIPSTCVQPCHNEHFLMDVLHHYTTAPKDCMLTATSLYLSYMPVSHSLTAEHVITRHTFTKSYPKICGLYIPVIPDVQFHVLNIRHVNRNLMQKEFFEEIDKIAETRTIKGLIVYVTEKFLLQSVEDIVFLDYIKKVQPDIPYALAGCIVEETMFEHSDVNTMIERRKDGYNFVSENLISIGLFTVPKTVDKTDPGEKCNFDMYSLVLESSDWSRAKIQQVMIEFATEVPHFEHSVALKLSCVGRDKKHDVEQLLFRAAFPQTSLAGCYGNGELGVNHPARAPTEASARIAKRHKHDPGQQGLMYSYSTVFLYIGWGKVMLGSFRTADGGSLKSHTKSAFQ